MIPQNEKGTGMRRDRTSLDVLFRDGDLIVVNKRPGLLSQADRSGDPDLLTLLAEETGRTVYPVHRLDRGVGGLVAVAASERAARVLSALVSGEDGRFRKEYLTVVHGRFDRTEGELNDYLLRDAGRTRVVPKGTGGAKIARLAYRVLSETDAEGSPLSLLAVRLFTGRTHQIRAQLSNACHPVAGDGRYGAHDRFPPLALFASFLAFPHPKTGRILRFSALPDAAPFNRFTIPAPGEKGFFDD